MSRLFGLPPLLAALLGLPVLLISVSFHECAHAWAADRLGDPTAKNYGRLTLNPLAHIDPFGTLLLPLILLLTGSGFIFGYARPVPTNFANLRNPHRDILWVGLAGPAANFILALAASLIIRAHVFPADSLLQHFFLYLILINLFLASFNLVPIPPLDGSRILMGLLPPEYAYRYSRLEPYGFLIILALFMLGLLKKIVAPIFYLLAYFLGL